MISIYIYITNNNNNTHNWSWNNQQKKNLKNVETTKKRKYEILANELKLMYGSMVINGWDGLVTKYYKKYMKSLDIKKQIQAYIQSIVLKRTGESLLIDFRKDCLMAEWLDEDIERYISEIELLNSLTHPMVEWM